MKYELKRLGIWSVMKISFLLGLALGFILGLFYAMILLPLVLLPLGNQGTFGDSSDMPLAVGGVLMLLMPIVMSIFLAIAYGIGGAIGAALYNLFSRWFGGAEVELREMAVAPTGGYSSPAGQPPDSNGTDNTT
jgi:hypothetical protein